VSEYLASQGIQLPTLHIGIPDRFIEHGSRNDCLTMAGLEVPSLTSSIECFFSTLPRLNTGTA
jgi:1-deoxy-D-xylulose-5-phosphate synthase